jgi:hypothetical protein
VAHIGEESALGTAGRFGRFLGNRQGRSALLDQFFQVVVVALQFGLGILAFGNLPGNAVVTDHLSVVVMLWFDSTSPQIRRPSCSSARLKGNRAEQIPCCRYLLLLHDPGNKAPPFRKHFKCMVTDDLVGRNPRIRSAGADG